MAEIESATPISELVAAYFAMWNETDSESRRAVIAATWAHDAGYVDPLFTAEGHAALDAMVATFQAQYPGHRFRPSGAVDAHHDRARWAWELASSDDAPPVAAGVDFAVLAPDGRLEQVTGFFTPLTTAA